MINLQEEIYGEAVRRMARAVVEQDAARHALEVAAIRLLGSRDIHQGGVVVVRFSEGDEECRFDGVVVWTFGSGDLSVKLTHKRKKGGWCKHPSYYDIDILDGAKPVE